MLDLNMNRDILLSIVNMKLRDYYPNLEELSLQEDLDINELMGKFKEMGYIYDEKTNQFIGE